MQFSTIVRGEHTDPLPGVWLTGNLTSHNAESAIFVQQTNNRQESRLTLVDLNLVKNVSDVFPRLKQDTFDVHSCLFHAITSKEEEMISSHTAWTEC